LFRRLRFFEMGTDMIEITLEQAVKIARESGWSGIYTTWISDTESRGLIVPTTPEQVHAFAKAIQAQTRREVLEEAAGKFDGTIGYNFVAADGYSNAFDIASELRYMAQEQSKPVQEQK
jgi:hypothetical protein